MQKKAGQNTFGGRFGGRMSSPEPKLKHLRRPKLFFRRPNPFGSKFRGPKPTPETKVSNLRRHLRRPNPPSRAETQNSRGQAVAAEATSSRVRQPNVPSAAELEFIQNSSSTANKSPNALIPPKSCIQPLKPCIYSCTCTKGSKTTLKPQQKHHITHINKLSCINPQIILLP